MFALVKKEKKRNNRMLHN